MQLDVEGVLNKFGKRVIKQSRTKLTKDKINASKELWESLNYDLKVSKNSFEIGFNMAPHGVYVNDGVKGIKKDRTKRLKNNLGATSFSYKKGIENKPSYKHFDKWMVRKGIAPRNNKGQFTSRRSLAVAISYGVWYNGLKTTEFFTKPFESAFEDLPDEVIKAYALTVDKLLANT